MWRLIEETVGFYETMKDYHSKTFVDLYKATVSTTQSVQKNIKADRKLLLRLFNATTGGRSLEMVQILKHELSPITLSLFKAGAEINSTPKAELISILMAGLQIPPEFPNVDRKIYAQRWCVHKCCDKIIWKEYKSWLAIWSLNWRRLSQCSDSFSANGKKISQFASSLIDPVFHYHRFGVISLPWMRTNLIAPSFCHRPLLRKVKFYQKDTR